MLAEDTQKGHSSGKGEVAKPMRKKPKHQTQLTQKSPTKQRHATKNSKQQSILEYYSIGPFVSKAAYFRSIFVDAVKLKEPAKKNAEM